MQDHLLAQTESFLKRFLRLSKRGGIAHIIHHKHPVQLDSMWCVSLYTDVYCGAFRVFEGGNSQRDYDTSLQVMRDRPPKTPIRLCKNCAKHAPEKLARRAQALVTKIRLLGYSVVKPEEVAVV